MRIKPIKCIRDYDKFFQIANIKLLRHVIADYRQGLMYVNKRTYELHLELSQVLHSDLWEVLDTMSYNRTENIGSDTKERHSNKLQNLKQNKLATKTFNYPHNEISMNVTAQHNINTVTNLSSYELNKNAVSVLSRGLNFAPTPKRIPVENIITSLESAITRNRIPHIDAECMRQDVSSMLRRSKLPTNNITSEERSALRDLRNNEDILVLPADKGNATVVVDTVEYERKITQMLSDGTKYKKVSYNPTTRVTKKVVQLLQDTGDGDLLKSLRPQNPTPPKIYGLPKIHKPDWPLRPIVSQIDSPTYKISKHIATQLQQKLEKTSSYVRDSPHFVQLLRDVKIEPHEIMVSFDITSLFTNVPVDDTLNIIRNIVRDLSLPADYVAWTELCLRSGYFIWKGDYYLQLDGVAMGSPIAPVVADIFMQWFEKTALSTTTVKPRQWWRYVDDIFAIIAKEDLPTFTKHVNGIHQNIQVTVEPENNGALPFLDLKVIRDSTGSLSHTVYRKLTHTDRYLHAQSHHHPSHLSSVPRTLINRALRLCDPQFIQSELEHVQRVLEDNGYNWQQSQRLVNGSGRKRAVGVERSPVFLPFVRGVTDKIGYLLQRKYNVKTIFRPPGQLRQMLRSPKDKDPLNVPGVYKIPCDCGKSYVGETRRNITTRLTEHIRSIKNVDTNRSALAEHAQLSDTKHFIRFDKASVLAKEKFFVPRKVREAIEISRHSTFNRDGGWTLPAAWKPILSTTRGPKVLGGLESDTVSFVCNNPFGDNAWDGDEEPAQQAVTAASQHACGSSAEPALPPPIAPRPSRRAERATARSLRRDLLA